MFSEFRRVLHDVFGWHKWAKERPPVWAGSAREWSRLKYLKCRYCDRVRFRGVHTRED